MYSTQILKHFYSCNLTCCVLHCVRTICWQIFTNKKLVIWTLMKRLHLSVSICVIIHDIIVNIIKNICLILIGGVVKKNAQTFWQQKRKILEGKISKQRNDPRKLWSSINILLGQARISESTDISADDFMAFCGKKIADVRKDTEGAQPPSYSPSPLSNFVGFTPLTVDNVRKLIADPPSKKSDLDPWPTWLMKDCANDISPYITRLINGQRVCTSDTQGSVHHADH